MASFLGRWNLPHSPDEVVLEVILKLSSCRRDWIKNACDGRRHNSMLIMYRHIREPANEGSAEGFIDTVLNYTTNS